MKIILRAFFGHAAIWLYLAVAAGLLIAVGVHSPEVLRSYWWVALLAIPLAPFFEWVMHRYVLHRAVNPTESPKGYAYMVDLHYRHHWDPNNLATVFAPISATVIMVGGLGLVALVFTRDLAITSIFVSGSLFYFLYYEWCHLAHHVPQYRPKTAYGKYTKMAHTWHHYKNENYYWGVTNPIGDWLLGTFPKPEDVERSPNARGLGKY
jgi:hypothetical protein